MKCSVASDKAIGYASKLNLQHRFLVIQEAAGLANGEGRTLLRQLLSEDEIRRYVVQSTKDGNEGKELPIVKGPVGLLMTTTANSLHWEDETRLLSLYVDQSATQIERALMVYDGDGPTQPSADDLSRWHALHEFVCSGDLNVEIPYRRMVRERLPKEGRVMRDFPKVLALIKAHALLHQCTRERNKDGHIVADICDYYVVHGLIKEPLAQGLHASVPPHIRELVEAVVKQDRKPISITELSSVLTKNPGVVSRYVQAAIKDGYLEDQNPGRGKKSMLIVGERELPRGTVLPDPSELIEEFGKPSRSSSTKPLQEDQSSGPAGNPERRVVA
jgi:hypothetical protein